MPAYNDIAPLEGYDSEIGLLLALMQDATNEWRLEMEAIPKEAVLWQESPTAVSMGGIMLHIVEAELWWIGEIIGGVPVSEEDKLQFRIAEIDPYGDRWPEPLPFGLKGYFKVMDEIRERTLSVLKSNGPSDRIVTADNRTRTIRWILGHLAQHESYHGGQIVLLAKQWQRQSGTPA